VTNLAVLDFSGPQHRMALRSVHPGVSVEEVVAATGFELTLPASVPYSREPTDEEMRLIIDVIDPDDLRHTEVP
jgi:acyl CoA:acetate/3-ketoacid CoA transferase beta subunit